MGKYVNLDTFFQIICVIATICLGAYVIRQYVMDEDLTEVSFKKFHEDKDSIYPEISICLTDAYLGDQLKEIGEEINGKTYKKFLNGELWDDRMAQIDYDNVTLDIRDYILETCIRQKFKGGHCEPFEAKTTTFVHQIRKCFTIHNPEKKSILYVEAKLNATIFPSSIRPTGHAFVLRFPFPHQLFRSATSTFLNWPDRTNSSKSFLMDFRIRNTHVLRRRQNKPSKPCLDWNNYDELVFEEMLEEVGCRPMYWNKPTSHPTCKEKEKMKMFVDKFYERYFPIDTNHRDIPPCLEVQYIKMSYKDLPPNTLDTRNNTSGGSQGNWFKIRLWYRSPTFMEIKQVKAYCFESVVGNGGGYVGLFLGYSLVQLPNLAKFLLSFLHKRFGNNNDKLMRRENICRPTIMQVTTYDGKENNQKTDEIGFGKRNVFDESIDDSLHEMGSGQFSKSLPKPRIAIITKGNDTDKYQKERVDWN